jgi:capsular exopolysaccharide synthesis family protein
MSRFFNQSADEQNTSPPSSPIAQPDSGIDEMLEHLRTTENEQVVSVRVATPTLEQFAAEELKGVFGHVETAAPPVAAAPTPAPMSPRAPVSLPMFPGRLTGSQDAVFFRAAEMFRMVRTRVLRAQTTQRFRSIVITSASASEGKTLTAANLALCCVQVANVRVLLVDADLRTSGLSRLLHLPQGAGLGEVLAGKATYDQAILTTDVPRLHIVGSGQCPLPPPEQLASPKFREFITWASGRYELVLVDSPPVLAVADYELIAAACEKIITVVLARRTKRNLLERALKLIDAEKRLGTIFNASDPPQKDAYSDYAYYGQGKRPSTQTRK